MTGKASGRRGEFCFTVLSYLYLALPVFIFLFGWLRWYWGIPCGLLAVGAFVGCIRESLRVQELGFSAPPAPAGTISGASRRPLVLLSALLLIILWVYLSGIGGYCYQNSDHAARNTIFRALVERDWPVLSQDGERGLVYYIGFWLPAACVGRAFGLEAGFAAQFAWAVLGVCLVYGLICLYRGKVDLLPILFLFFFSGLDYAGTWLLDRGKTDLSLAYHLEWWAKDFQFSSATTQIFWVFNQAIPAWVATMLLLLQKGSRNVLFLLSLVMLSSTFPFVGLLPLAICLFFQRGRKGKFRELLTFQNMVGVAVIGVVSFLYLTGNLSSAKVNSPAHPFYYQAPVVRFLVYLLFCALEFGVYLPFLWKYRRREPLFWVSVGILLCCPFLRVGDSADFCMRASIPALLVLMLFCMDALERLAREGKRRFALLFCVLLLVGAVTPWNEMHRTAANTYHWLMAGEPLQRKEVEIDTELLQANNFSGKTGDGIFYRFLAK